MSVCPSCPITFLPAPFRRRSLAGKPGAARKALEALLTSDASAPSPLSAQLLLEPYVPILADELDEAASNLFAQEEEDEGALGTEVPPLGEAAGDEEEEDALMKGQQGRRGGAAGQEGLEAEARVKGFGRLYAALGGGREGLEACVAMEALCEVGGRMVLGGGREGLEACVAMEALCEVGGTLH